MPGTISRRSVVGLVGVGGLAGVLVGQVEGAPAVAQGTAAQEGALPLQVGTRFGRWTVSAIHPIREGVLTLDVRDAEQREFALEVMARDPSPLAAQPPAVTDALAVYVRNGGDGWLPTEEEQGLAAMTLAHRLTTAGAGGPIEGLLTHSARVVEHHAKLMGEELAPRERLA